MYTYNCTIIIMTVPEVECIDPVSADGSLTIQWYFVHTGGLNLTGLSAEYSYVDGTSTEVRPVTVDSLNTTTIKQRGLVAGFEYTFNITAENSNGSSTISCRPVPYRIGECNIPLTTKMHLTLILYKLAGQTPIILSV